MWAEINRDIASCATCAASEVPRQLPVGNLKPLPVPHRTWSHIAIDFVTDLPVFEGNTAILTIVDCFSKDIKFATLPALPSAFQTAETLFHEVFCYYSLPEDIVSRGPQFTLAVWEAFIKKLGASISLTSGYHPESNGQCKRANQELGKFLCFYCQRNQND